MLKNYVCFTTMGFLGDDGLRYREIALKDISLIRDIPADADYLQFCTRQEVESGGETLYGDYNDYSERIGIGEVITINTLKGQVDNDFIKQWGYDKYSHFVWTKSELAIPIKDGDVAGKDYIIRPNE